MSSALRLAALWLVLIFAVGLGRGVSAAEPTPAELDGITVNEHLGDAVDPELSFTDHRGETVRIGDYWGDGKPVLLTLNYYTCGTSSSIRSSCWPHWQPLKIAMAPGAPATPPHPLTPKAAT